MALGGLTAAAGFLMLSYCAWEVSRCKWSTWPPEHTAALAVDKARRRPAPPPCCGAPLADRDMLKLTQQDFTGPPQHLQLQLLVATVLCSIGAGGAAAPRHGARPPVS